MCMETKTEPELVEGDLGDDYADAEWARECSGAGCPAWGQSYLTP